MAAVPFDEGQVTTLVVLERVGGSLSLVSVFLILVSYFLFPRLRTVPNTFIVFASVANAFSAIACIIAYDGIRLGQTSPLCQLQGFLLEMFVQSDPWWSLAMAINVLSVFIHNTNPHTIKKWGWLYCLVCYGGPFGIALACLLINAPGKSLVYGEAGTWCWISEDWSALRIYTCYMLVWVCILTSLVIYAGIGFYLFQARSKSTEASEDGSRGRESDRLAPSDYTQDRRSVISISDWPMTPNSTNGALFNSAFAELLSGEHRGHSRQNSASSPFVDSSVTRPDRAHSPHRSPNIGQDTHSCSLYPSSPGMTPFLISATPGRSPSPSLRSKRDPSIRETLNRFSVDDPVKRAYLRTALLFALSVLVTWIPTSVHRVHEVLHSESPFSYNLATAIFLPLQGTWNGIIFFATSWTVFRECVADLAVSCTKPKETPKKGGSIRKLQHQQQAQQRRRRPTRLQGKTVYSMWRDADPSERDENKSKTGIGLGISWKGREPSSASKRRDSWDFLDIGVDETQMIGFQEISCLENTSKKERNHYGSRSSNNNGRSTNPKVVVVECPGGMI